MNLNLALAIKMEAVYALMYHRQQPRSWVASQVMRNQKNTEHRS